MHFKPYRVVSVGRTTEECKDEWIEATDILRNTSSEKPE